MAESLHRAIAEMVLIREIFTVLKLLGRNSRNFQLYTQSVLLMLLDHDLHVK